MLVDDDDDDDKTAAVNNMIWKVKQKFKTRRCNRWC